tara:strand:+ start:563 stop:703 length:141 start_codon:yes stop_codon:yes gene_type:complete
MPVKHLLKAIVVLFTFLRTWVRPVILFVGFTSADGLKTIINKYSEP